MPPPTQISPTREIPPALRTGKTGARGLALRAKKTRLTAGKALIAVFYCPGVADTSAFASRPVLRLVVVSDAFEAFMPAVRFESA